MIIEKILEVKARKIKGYPVNSNRASDLGIPCVRYHVLNRTKWQEKALHDVGLQLVFDLGNEIEEIVLHDLAEAGVKVIEQQRSFSWPEYQITGHIDGIILMDCQAIPLEIKSCSPYVFKSLNTINDLKNGKYGYLRKYPAQLCLYMLMSNKEHALFLFKEKSSGALKEIPMQIDYELGEELLKRAESINKHIAAGTLPDPINQEMWCNGCAFSHICLPEEIGKEVEIDTGELEAMLDRLDELKPFTKEYDEIDDQIKRIVEGKEKILAGNWFVTGKYLVRKSYDVPSDVKLQYEKVTQYWKRTVKRIAA